jgi:hypothetical protein
MGKFKLSYTDNSLEKSCLRQLRFYTNFDLCKQTNALNMKVDY